jgi:monothiol glutaredoxin
MNDTVKAQIEQTLAAHPIVLYLKGTPDFPQCGFSHRVAEILKTLDVSFHAVDVLEDEAVRSGIKDFGRWPTIPQLYVRGVLLGGCDIVCQLYENGELEGQLKAAVN